VSTRFAPECSTVRRDRQSTRSTALALGGFVLLVLGTHWWGEQAKASTRIGLGVPPLHATWQPRTSAGTWVALATGLAIVVVAPVAARRLAWRVVPRAVGAGAALWSIVLAAIDGSRGLTAGVANRHGYLAAVDRVGSPVAFLDQFTNGVYERSFPVHVAGHPPGFVMLLSLLDRVGLGGPKPAATLCIAGGAVALALVCVAVRDVAGEQWARDAAPFLVLSPAAVWIATTPDAFFALPGAAAVALFVIATSHHDRKAVLLAAAGGACFGVTLMLSYGLALLAVIAVLVARRRGATRLLAIAATAAGLTVVAFVPFGFWWPAGLLATRWAYWDGIASTRPLRYFLVANLAAFAICIGPATVVALTWLRERRLLLLVGGALMAVLLANASAMSKGEVERIWLPFAIWVLPAGATFASRRGWVRAMLLVQLVCALGVQSLVRPSG
jgi:hypothetical protein